MPDFERQLNQRSAPDVRGSTMYVVEMWLRCVVYTTFFLWIILWAIQIA